MAVTYVGDEGRFYTEISVAGQTLAPVPGQSYEIEDPGDGRWVSVSTSEGTTTTVAPVVAQSGENEPTEAVEGES